MTKKQEAADLLARYDAMRAELRTLERDLGKACAEYGRTIGVWGYSRDHLRMQLEREKAA